FGSAFDLDWTNLPARPMFVPMMQEIVRQGIGLGASNQSIVAGEQVVEPVWTVSSHRVSINTSGKQMRTQSNATNGDSSAGIEAQVDSQGTTRSFVVINPDARASLSTVHMQDDVANELDALIDVEEISWFERGDVGAQAMNNDEGSQGSDESQVKMLDASAP